MYVAVTLGKIQWKNRFTMAEGESKNFIVVENGMLVCSRNSGKGLMSY